MLMEHLVEVHGLPALNAILKDINDGIQINEALERHTKGLDELETSFAKYLDKLATAYASGVEFTTEELAAAKLTDLVATETFLKQYPQSFPAMLLYGTLLIKADRLDEAEAELKRLTALRAAGRRRSTARGDLLARKCANSVGQVSANAGDADPDRASAVFCRRP